MIATLSGKIQSLHPDRVVVDVAGVGYEVYLATAAAAKMPERGADVFLYIHTHVREDAFVLYGFPEEKEKEFFLILKTISGIGPKMALAMLSGLSVDEFCRAVAEADVKLLTTLQGVGKKTAERICVELKDKIGHLATTELKTANISAPVTGGAVADALSALQNLGYSDPVVRVALTSVKNRLGKEKFSELGLEELIKEGLKALA